MLPFYSKISFVLGVSLFIGACSNENQEVHLEKEKTSVEMANQEIDFTK